MKTIEKTIKEFKFTLNSIEIVDVILNASILLIILILAFMLLSLPLIYTLPLTTLYLAAHIYLRIRQYKLNLVQDKYPTIQEQLITAADNLDNTNPIVSALNQDVVRITKDMHASAFVPLKSIFGKTAILIGLSFLIIFMASLNVQFFDVNVLFDDARDLFYQEFKDLPTQQVPGAIGTEVSAAPSEEEIFGEKKVASLGTKKLDIEIKAASYDIDVRTVKKARKQRFDDAFPSDIAAESAEAYGENIAQEHREIVKNYFKSIV